MSLEESINAYHRPEIRGPFIQDLLKELIVPGPASGGVYYLKDDAAFGLARRLEQDGVRFSADETKDQFAVALYSAINKVPLKQVGYGMLNATLPRQVAEQLMPWEAVYAYAGTWAKKSATSPRYGFVSTTLNNSTLYRIVHDLVMRGVERIKFVHDREVESGKYKNRMDKVPHEAEVLARFTQPTRNIWQLGTQQTSLF